MRSPVQIWLAAPKTLKPIGLGVFRLSTARTGDLIRRIANGNSYFQKRGRKASSGPKPTGNRVASSNLASSSKDSQANRLGSFSFIHRKNWRPHPPNCQRQFIFSKKEVVRLPAGLGPLETGWPVQIWLAAPMPLKPSGFRGFLLFSTHFRKKTLDFSDLKNIARPHPFLSLLNEGMRSYFGQKTQDE